MSTEVRTGADARNAPLQHLEPVLLLIVALRQEAAVECISVEEKVSQLRQSLQPLYLLYVVHLVIRHVEYLEILQLLNPVQPDDVVVRDPELFERARD